MDFGRSIVTTTVMTVGELNYEGLLITSLHGFTNRTGIVSHLVPFPFISNAFFYIFLLTMPIVLMNLLVRVRIVCRGGEGRGVMTPLVPFLVTSNTFFYMIRNKLVSKFNYQKNRWG